MKGVRDVLERLPYSLWKNYYRSFPADQFDQGSQTILVELPDTPPITWPESWTLSGDHYTTPGGCLVRVLGSGWDESYYVEHIKDRSLHRTIHPGIDSRKRVLNAVKFLECLVWPWQSEGVDSDEPEENAQDG